jgi:hypothetical protein
VYFVLPAIGGFSSPGLASLTNELAETLRTAVATAVFKIARVLGQAAGVTCIVHGSSRKTARKSSREYSVDR